jgi:hypothetical protein
MLAALIGGLAPSNPDNRGYLGPAFALLAVFSGAALLFGLATFHLPRLRPILAGLLLVGALTRFPYPDQYPSLRQATVAQAATEEVLGRLPVRAALFTNHFETGFLVGYQRLVEASRPDVAWAHLAFVGGPGAAERMSLAEPDLAPSLQAYRERRFSLDVLRPLDNHRPVRIEADIMLPPELRRQRSLAAPARLDARRRAGRPASPRLPRLALVHRRRLVLRQQGPGTHSPALRRARCPHAQGCTLRPPEVDLPVGGGLALPSEERSAASSAPPSGSNPSPLYVSN